MTILKTAPATIRDVAQRAGVSVATVSRIINETGPVAAETVARVRQAMEELKYIPKAAARNLSNRKTDTIGLLLTDIHGDFFAPLLSGIEAMSRSAGYDLLISTSSRAPSRLDLPVGPHNTDGLLIFANSVAEVALRRYYELGFPMVLIHQLPPEGMEIPAVTVENKAASCKIVEHLIERHARRRIVLLRGPADQDDSRWREIGYRQALESHGLGLDEQLVAQGDFDRNVAAASIARLLQEGVSFDAVFSGDDESSVGVLAALHEAGVKVPEEVAVVGFDDQRLSSYLNPPLTTVRAPTEQVGHAAAEQLIRLIRTGEAEPTILLPTEMIVRRSCGCA